MFSMSWRSSLLEAPFPGTRASRPQRAEGPPLLMREGRPRSRGRRSRHVRPRCGLAGLVFGLTLVALPGAMPKAGASGEGLPAGGEFTLTSTQGPVNLSDHRGKVVLLFFGFTSCPDICPLSLARIGACLSSLEAEQAERVSALFITLDPDRDTAERMGRYAGFFHPGIVGLTGDAEAIDDVTARYGITWERKSSPESALGYSISHPDTILLVDDEGTLVGEVGGEDGGEALRQKVLELLANRG